MLYFQNTSARVLSDCKLPVRTRHLLEKSLAQLDVPLLVDCWGANQLLVNEGKSANANLLKIRIDHPGVVRMLIQERDPFQLLEAYLGGYLHFDASVEAIPHFANSVQKARPTLLECLHGWLESFALPKIQLAAAGRRWQGMVLGSKERDREAVRYHYDVGNEFYQLWLCRNLVYSCAYFAEAGMDLTEAQEAKLDLICRKLRLRQVNTSWTSAAAGARYCASRSRIMV